MPPVFSQIERCSGFARKSFCRMDFSAVGHGRSLTVLDGHVGSNPGQNLDKFSPAAARIDRSRRGFRHWIVSCLILGSVAAALGCGDRQQRRSKAEIETERNRLRSEAEQEVDALVAEYHAKLPRETAKSIGSIYARFSTRFQKSVGDQVRTLLELAVLQGIFVPRENIFFDIAVRGCKQSRAGIDALKATLNRKAAKVLLVLSTSRLARKAYLTLRFVEEEIVARGLRCIFLSNGIDTNNPQWRLMLGLYSVVDEQGATANADHVRSAHVGLHRNNHVWGSLPYGYLGEDVAGPATRRGKPRQQVVIDEPTAKWVRRIFAWYALDGLSEQQIAQRLNDAVAPTSARSETGEWTECVVRAILRNARYRGLWCYGTAQAIWLSGKDYAKRELREQPVASAHISNLQIVDDALWGQTQARITGNVAKWHHWHAGEQRQERPALLNGVFYCAAHDRALQVGGTNGKYAICPVCRRLSRDKRPLFSYLDRRLSLRIVCRTIADNLVQDDDLVREIVESSIAAVREAQLPDSATEGELRHELAKLKKRIEFVLSTEKHSAEDADEAQLVLSRLRAERDRVSESLKRVDAAKLSPPRVPNEAEVRQLLSGFAEILLTAATATDAELLAQARAIVEMVTGGRINLYQQGTPSAQRGWLEGRFTLRVIAPIVDKLVGLPVTVPDDGLELHVEFRGIADNHDQVQAAMTLYDQDLPVGAIAEALGVCRNRATKLINQGLQERGEGPLNARQRARKLPRPQDQLPAYKAIADAAQRMWWDEFMWDCEIARKLKSSDSTVRKAIKYWYTSRGKTVPTKKDRNAAILSKAMGLKAGGATLGQIAKVVHRSSAWLSQQFRKAGMPSHRSKKDVT